LRSKISAAFRGADNNKRPIKRALIRSVLFSLNFLLCDIPSSDANSFAQLHEADRIAVTSQIAVDGRIVLARQGSFPIVPYCEGRHFCSPTIPHHGAMATIRRTRPPLHAQRLPGKTPPPRSEEVHDRVTR
jgi:hypothetical protein